MNKSICLALICKNEEHCILECLESVYKFINYWVISDTGSTDKTCELIHNFFKEKKIPGELYHDEFKNLGYNRTILLKRAQHKTDYILHFDADDYFVGDLDLKIFDSQKDIYQLNIKRGDTFFKSNILISGKYEWKACGVAHAFLKNLNKENVTIEQVDNKDYYLESRTVGSRSFDSNKYQNEAELIKKEFFDTLVFDPDGLNRWSLFYTAQSYFDAKMYDESIKWYSLYTKLKDSWDEEVFDSYLKIGKCMIYLDYQETQIEEVLSKAINLFPDRAEPYFIVGKYYNKKNNFEKGYFYLKNAIEKSFDDVLKKYTLFVDNKMYGKHINDELSVACYWLEKYPEGYKLLNEIIDDIYFKEHKDRLIENRKFFEKKINNIY